MEQSLPQRIGERAYEMWKLAGRADGQADHHWLAAEREVLAAMTARTSATKTVASHRHPPDRGSIAPRRKKVAKAG